MISDAEYELDEIVPTNGQDFLASDVNRKRLSSEMSTTPFIETPEPKKSNLLGESCLSVPSTGGSSVSSIFSFTKTHNITEAERSMNGAPEGELFEVNVLTDEEILPSENPNFEIVEAVEGYNESSVWASKHIAIESMRRILLHHVNYIGVECTSQYLGAIVCCSIDSASSLRSSTSKNAILCLQLILKKSKDFSLEASTITRKNENFYLNY